MSEFNHLYQPGEPTLVLLHGTGGNEAEMFAIGSELYPGAGLLAPRGKEPERGMNRWFRRLQEGVFDEPNLLMRADELANFVVEKLPVGKRIAVGFSNGANIAAAILLRRPEVFSAALLLAPMVPFVPEPRPDLKGVRIHMDCGENDPKLAALFSKAGAKVSLRWHSGGHGLDSDGLAEAKVFLQGL
jgi:phospholipase/carboxylesterase